ncbi:hypothetical protein PspLS_07136 [Pyricularia sp. CBS 133598]|nr:hypothetical protein PspLS_07136 [Pyricularia sp. CBS 133598]
MSRTPVCELESRAGHPRRPCTTGAPQKQNAVDGRLHLFVVQPAGVGRVAVLGRGAEEAHMRAHVMQDLVQVGDLGAGFRVGDVVMMSLISFHSEVMRRWL